MVVSPEEVARVERGELPNSFHALQRMQDAATREAPPPRPPRFIDGTLLACAVKRNDSPAAAVENGAGAIGTSPPARDDPARPIPLWEIVAIAGTLAIGIVSIWLLRSR